MQHALDLERRPAEQLVLVDVLVPRQQAELLARAGREGRPYCEHLVPDGGSGVANHVGLYACTACLDDDEWVGAKRQVFGLAHGNEQRRHARIHSFGKAVRGCRSAAQADSS